VLARGQVALDAIGALRESASSARHAGGRPNAGRLARGG
jgi:hypothetical protein